ncbi:FAD assembly factor SdhE [Spiribacter halobius]|uniref:FAD assembly factor SdhE n=1 Tax=Sediminicurvatus halobius TaxID=2182432 RepID=A0A2U2N3F1_9GAMM|nr:succinate dehydrogenase assembly factor 2 [Spiribacter halobius]PWG63755.1 succinate dehydrogenase assembly factor 2 [Spiribacter halobius]UEX76236.1 succinate dehydrogenase assembly factor 2 [Spiribacter halobius]
MSETARLRWRCRRGTKELDALLVRFLEGGHAALDEQGRVAFDRLLECEDDDLIDWLLKGEVPRDGTLAEITRQIRAASGL